MNAQVPAGDSPVNVATACACFNILDNLPLSSGRFSVLRGGLRHLSLKALPTPLYILGGVMVSMQAGSAVRAGMPADR